MQYIMLNYTYIILSLVKNNRVTNSLMFFFQFDSSDINITRRRNNNPRDVYR